MKVYPIETMIVVESLLCCVLVASQVLKQTVLYAKGKQVIKQTLADSLELEFA